MNRKRILLTTLLFSICVFVGVHLAITYAKYPVSAATSKSHKTQLINTNNDSNTNYTDSNNINTNNENVDAENAENTETQFPETPKKPSSGNGVKKTYTGLKKIDGHIYYYVKGKPFCNGLKTVKIKNKKFYYFFQKNGQAFTSGLKTVYIDGQKYYFYFQKNGRALTEKLKAVSQNGKKYYFYFQKNGKALTERWKTINKKKYYFGENGKAYTGTKTVSHYLCHFDKKGVMYRQIDKNKKMVALTYDDGPSIYTPKILKTLKDNNAVATFFVVGSRVSTYSDTVKSEYKMHCQIGNHSYNHPILTKVGADTIKKEISKTNDTIKKVTGEKPIIMRPPGGATNSTVKKNVKMPMIIWSVDTLDWKTRNAESTQKAVLDHVKDGDIVLMHDLYDATATASQTIIPELVKRGYQLVTVSELAQCRGSKLKNGKSYFSFKKK